MALTTTKKRNFHKKRYRKKNYSQSEKKMYQIAKYVSRSQAKKQIDKQFEKHYHDHADNQAITWAGVVTDISSILVGDTDQVRTGDRVTIKSVSVRGTVENGDSGGNLTRVMLIQWFQDDFTAPPTPAQIIQSTAVATRFSPYAPYSKDDAGYLWVPLADVTLCTSPSGSNIQAQFKFSLTAKDFKRKAKPFIQYQEGLATGTNKLYLVFFSDSGAVSHPSVSHWSRIRYIAA